MTTPAGSGPGELAELYGARAEELLVGIDRCPTCGEPSLRIGTDVQEVAAVAAGLERHGEHYLARLFTEQEVRDCRAGAASWTVSGVASLAARYAAKESVIKVLRPVHSGVDWRLVEMVRHPAGWTSVVLHGSASRQAREAGLGAWAASFAHDGGVAVATVLARHRCRESDASDSL